MKAQHNGGELPESLRDTAAKLLRVARELALDAHGLPCNPSQQFEIWSATSWAHHLTAVLRSPAHTPAGELRTIADQFDSLVIATKAGHRTAAIGQRWLALRERAAAAYDSLFGPPDLGVPDTLPADTIESLRDSTDPDGPPTVRLDADDEVSDGEDIPTVEGGYVWHTDGRPPEPLRA